MQQKPGMENKREPCPDRIMYDVGGAFGMGAVGGGIWHFIKGLKNSPKGYKMQGAAEAVRREAPRLGGSFANWGLAFALFDCSLQAIRKKEDPWNAITAGALTGGFLQLRFGLGSAAKSAAFGGFLLAIIEGLSISMNKLTSPPPPGVQFNPGMGGPGGMPGGMPGGPGGPGMAPLPGIPGGEIPVGGAEADSGITGWFNNMLGGGAPAPSPSSQAAQEMNLNETDAPAMPDFSSSFSERRADS